ncbi:hypothetical protein J2X56_005273 [Herbaspirillum sp. 1173]|uniref:hypothetical protein n=1 Tax=Herbaspirillum sp. 1173 TaxID=2817734 RepID=UPI002860F0A8|nr:hypothetical protein [Herbaspirillum sp. 1173]MDR6743236.1 hypothetical protein [Herbaspirillum sp. 1173]
MIAQITRRYPEMLNMAKAQSSFPKMEKMVVACIANADTVEEAKFAYEHCYALVPDWKFVFASAKGASPGLSVHREFSDGSVVRGLFATERIFVLDPQVLNEMNTMGSSTFATDYSISLDTQMTSYLAPYLEGNLTKLPKDIHEIFSFIARDDVFVDALPYMLENLPNIQNKENVEAIKKKLIGYERLRTLDCKYFKETGKVRSQLDDVAFLDSVNGHLERMLRNSTQIELMTGLTQRIHIMYCLLLKMAIIQLANPKRSLKSKLVEFMEFQDKELHTICARETIVAKEYFTRGQDLKFFGAIQKTTAEKLPDKLGKLKGMAWDFWHIRSVEAMVTIDEKLPQEDRTHARYFFPSFLTCDKKLIEIVDIYPLKSYAYKTDSSELFPFAALDWVKEVAQGDDDNFVSKYLHPSEVERRYEMTESAKASLPGIVVKLEAEFLRVANTGAAVCPADV